MGSPALIVRAATREKLTHDLGPLREVVARGVYAAALALLSAGSERYQTKALQTLLRLHSGAFSPSIDRRITPLLREALHDRRSRNGAALSRLFHETSHEAAHRHRTSPTPTRILG